MPQMTKTATFQRSTCFRSITAFCFENKMAAFEKFRNLVRVSRLFKGSKNALSEASSRNGSTQSTPFRKRTQEELSAYVKEIESRVRIQS